MKSAIGIDIGGTKISGVLGTPSGKVLSSFQIPTGVRTHAKSCLNRLLSEIQNLKDQAAHKGFKVCGIGVCLPGAVDSEKGVVPRSPNLPGWKGIKLRSIIQKRFRLPVQMVNDANAAAVAEHSLGAAKGLSNFIYLTVSTGIGSGIFIQGKLLEGKSFVAGEVGHMTLVPDGSLCACGNRGCLEAYASGTAIMREYRRTTKSKSLFHGAREIGALAKKGNRAALKVYQKAAWDLGIGLANLLNVLNPEMIILGGGVFKSAPSSYWKAILASTKKHAWPEAYHSVTIVRSSLDENVGNLGALALGFKK